MSEKNPTEESTPTQVGQPTPGPWVNDVVQIHAAQGACVKAGGECVVCFGHDYDEYGFIVRDEDRALILAAPDLLQALRELLCSITVVDGSLADAIRTALAAIDKAEGR